MLETPVLLRYFPAFEAILMILPMRRDRIIGRTARQKFAAKPFREAALFEKAYLIHLFQEMIEAGVKMTHADTPGNYMEVDTQEDFELARKYWRGN